LNELGFSLENLCKGVLRPNLIRHIYDTFDPQRTGFFKEENFVKKISDLGEGTDEEGLRRFF